MQAFFRLSSKILECLSKWVVSRSKAVATSDLCFVDIVFLLLKVKCKGTHARVNAELLYGTTTGGEAATTTVEVCKTVRVIAPNGRVLQFKSLVFHV